MTPWDDLPDYEQERLSALEGDEMIAALLDARPKASAKDLAEATGLTKAECKVAREAWVGAKRGAALEDETILPTREAILSQLLRAANTGDAVATERYVRALVALERAGSVDAEKESTEEWDRLSDREEGLLIALTRKLNGMPLSGTDCAWLAELAG